MKKSFAAAALAAALMLALTACGTAQQTAPAASPTPTAAQASTQTSTGKSAGSGDWKTEFEKSLWENYQVTPDHYEDLGNGVYQVYVKINGKVVPYVAVDSATGDYHG